jgi:hypothetical protein
MTPKLNVSEIAFVLLSFFVPLALFTLSGSHSLMFDDAAEFALVIKLGSIAHPPGVPAYILVGKIWTTFTSLFEIPVIDSLTLFASVCVSLSSVLLFLTFRLLTKKLSLEINSKSLFICCLIAISFATASTSWAWSNTIEVYSFQVLAMAVAFSGLTHYHFYKSKSFLLFASLGVSAGLSGHHLTMILFLPFILFFFTDNLFIPKDNPGSKKKTPQHKEGLTDALKKILLKKDFWFFASSIVLMTILFYGWMFWRAQSEYPYMFGKPGTIDELVYHIMGGSYSKNISSTPGNIIGSRLPYFLKLTALQLFLFLPFFIVGLINLFSRKLYSLATLTILYFLMLFIYQLNNNQWSSTDAYMLLPFMLLTVVVFYGVIINYKKVKGEFIIPVLLGIQIAYNFQLNDRRSYPVSDSLMTLLDKSAPKNSIILISDWSTVIQYYYYRLVENFRTDLVVLNYDFKFTHFRILPILYSDFYKQIQPEYDTFIDELSKEHPYQIVNTGCDLSTMQLTNAFRNLVRKTEEVAKADNKFFLTDPRAHYFFSTQNFYDSRRYVSGCFSSSMPGDTIANDNFVKLDLAFLNSPLLLKDPAALDKLVDFQAMLDRHIEFYRANNYLNRLNNAVATHDRILRLQRKMKKSMSFAYEVK